jgi:hypothetical protein
MLVVLSPLRSFSFFSFPIPAGMYGSQVWGTSFLQASREFSNSLSTLHLHFMKGTFGVKQSTTNWAVL